MKSSSRRSVFVSLCLLAATPLHARGVSPYLPLNLDPELEREVERVLILGDKPVMTRPIPAAMVLDALPRACAIDPPLCRRVRRALKVYMRDSALEFASVEGSAVNGDSKLVIPNQHGQDEQSAWQAAGAGFIQPWDHFLLNLGGVAEAGQAGRLPGPDQRAHQHQGEVLPGQGGAEPLGLLPPVVGQREVGAAGVPAGHAPLGGPVADEDGAGPPDAHRSRR